ncbi:MAG: prolipoprotein diacylglyceryl transferase [Coriobacteriales bacterium]|nr:prolipoprotein diacylglyceryl transferase [Coriobacteriales bacterium]
MLASLNDIYQNLDPIAFSVGSFDVRWYGLAYLAGFLLGGFVLYRVAKRWKLGISAEDVVTLVVFAACGILLGARLGYCLFYGNGYYLQHPLDILKVWEGGMSFHGGLMGAIVAIILVARYLRIPFLTLADLITVAAPVGLFFGRCANFINGELWGAPTTLPWGVVFATTGGGPLPRHPSQLYEAILEGLVLLVIMLILARRNNPPRPQGTFAGVFMLCYGIFRIAVEFVRVPDVQLGYLAGDWLTMGICLSVPLVVAGVVFLLWAHRAQRPQRGVATQ